MQVYTAHYKITLIADRYGFVRLSAAKARKQSTERHNSVIAMAHCDQRIAGARDMETSYSRSRRSVESGEKADDGDWFGENDGHMYSGIGLHMSRDARWTWRQAWRLEVDLSERKEAAMDSGSRGDELKS